MCLHYSDLGAPPQPYHQHKHVRDRPNLPTFCGSQEALDFFKQELDYDPDISDALSGIRNRYPDQLPATARSATINPAPEF